MVFFSGPGENEREAQLDAGRVKLFGWGWQDLGVMGEGLGSEI